MIPATGVAASMKGFLATAAYVLIGILSAGAVLAGASGLVFFVIPMVPDLFHGPDYSGTAGWAIAGVLGFGIPSAALLACVTIMLTIVSRIVTHHDRRPYPAFASICVNSRSPSAVPASDLSRCPCPTCRRTPWPRERDIYLQPARGQERR